MSDISFACQCGATQWSCRSDRSAARLKCYCKDCQAFANHLNASKALDEHGGTDLVQTNPMGAQITKGRDNIAALRLSPKGLMRWYTTCCNTPVANTLSNPGVAFLSLMLTNAQNGADQFGPVICHANTKCAHGDGAPTSDYGIGKMMRKFAKRAVGARISGAYKDNPFFNFPERTPIATTTVLTKDQRDAATPRQG